MIASRVPEPRASGQRRPTLQRSHQVELLRSVAVRFTPIPRRANKLASMPESKLVNDNAGVATAPVSHNVGGAVWETISTCQSRSSIIGSCFAQRRVGGVLGGYCWRG